ncbi:ATP-dependent sacrificial sulfur transferase LarE [Chitinispirillales bacterium ANBcel5]|uniref:ATP-dependent sacrificial sulfur transferase LarE n=1 Tax=Cellulosispirillum alkaliphilum TaxID=3039283 RepID=UPI002A508646|nr:ATP-dependent sacrificial sulfur transferase LarE [Chitinispirillales bacterium ANBcel5]
MKEELKKLEKLKSNISQYESAVIAFSGGCDSTLLAAVTRDVLKTQNILLVTALSSTYSSSELEDSKKFSALLGLKQQFIVSEELEIEGFSINSPLRCYYCKKALFSKIKELATDKGYCAVFDGSNCDDLNDYRPGRRALKEFNVQSPLCESGLTKKNIRAISNILRLPSAEKPAMACLASRFPYGEKITKSKLERVGRAENGIKILGFNQLRVRSHGDLARIEIDQPEIDNAWKMRKELEKVCYEAGFVYSALDLKGFRSGAMNESIEDQI